MPNSESIPGIERYLIHRPRLRNIGVCASPTSPRAGATETRRYSAYLGEGPRQNTKTGHMGREGRRRVEDVAESYGPSTSRSNILANLCPIKINQTPSRSAVSVHQRSAPPSTSATFLRPFNDKVDLR